MENIKPQHTENTVSKQSRTRGLKPFKPGQSGNPKGRPKGSISMTAAIKERLLKKYPEKTATIIGPDGKKYKKERKTYLQKIIEATFENAVVQRDPRTLNQIWAYLDGHPKATIDIGADKDSLEELTEFFKKMATPKNDS